MFYTGATAEFACLFRARFGLRRMMVFYKGADKCLLERPMQDINLSNNVSSTALGSAGW